MFSRTFQGWTRKLDRTITPGYNKTFCLDHAFCLWFTESLIASTSYSHAPNQGPPIINIKIEFPIVSHISSKITAALKQVENLQSFSTSHNKLHPYWLLCLSLLLKKIGVLNVHFVSGTKWVINNSTNMTLQMFVVCGKYFASGCQDSQQSLHPKTVRYSCRSGRGHVLGIKDRWFHKTHSDSFPRWGWIPCPLRWHTNITCDIHRCDRQLRHTCRHGLGLGRRGLEADGRHLYGLRETVRGRRGDWCVVEVVVRVDGRPLRVSVQELRLSFFVHRPPSLVTLREVRRSCRRTDQRRVWATASKSASQFFRSLGFCILAVAVCAEDTPAKKMFLWPQKAVAKFLSLCTHVRLAVGSCCPLEVLMEVKAAGATCGLPVSLLHCTPQTAFSVVSYLSMRKRNFSTRRIRKLLQHHVWILKSTPKSTKFGLKENKYA